MIANNKVIDGQNISLDEALSQCGFCCCNKEGSQFELVQGNKKFVLSGLVGVVREIPVLEEDIEAGNSANGEQEIQKSQRQGQKKESNDTSDNIQLAPEPIKEKDLEKEESDFRKAFEQNGFHIVGEDGSQTSKNKKSNKKF